MLPLEPVDGSLLQGAVDPHVGDGIDPGTSLMVEIIIVEEGTAVEEAPTPIAHGPFDLAFG